MIDLTRSGFCGKLSVGGGQRKPDVMLCDVSDCTTDDLADELLRRGADLILLPGDDPSEIDARFKTNDRENTHRDAVTLLSTLMDVLQRLIDQEMRYAPECDRCQWRGWDYQNGSCPVCGNQLTEHVE